MNIISEISNIGLYTLLFLIIAAGLSFLVYHFRIKNDEFTKGQYYFLSLVKFIYTLIILFLLLNPIIETIKERKEKPILVVGIDNSISISNDTTNVQFVNEFKNSLIKELSDQFQLELYTFGDKVSKNGEINFSDKKSNYASFFNEIEKSYYNLNLGSVILIGDGIYNEGKNPEQLSNSITCPVYTIGLGDSLSKSDQAISDITHNPNVFVGNSFPIEVEAVFNDFNFKSTQLTVSIDGKIKHSEQIDVPQANYYLKRNIVIKADEPGLKTVTVAIAPFFEEQNTSNNQQRFTIEVHENKNSILFLSQGPHPDIGAITETLLKQANFKVNFSEVTLFAGNIADYDLIVLNQLPSARTQNNDIFKKIIEKKIPLLLILGPNSSISSVNNLNINFSLQPTLLRDESTPNFNNSFALFNLPATIKEVENVFPPLLTFHTEYNYGSEYSVLAYQRINGVDLNYPLILAGQVSDRKIGIITGEGIWRWRFQEYQNYNNQNNFNQIIISLFDYLCLKETREQFKIEYKKIVDESTQIELKAQVFNDLYEPIITSEIPFILTDSLGREFNYLFSPNAINYTLNLGYLSPGPYRFTTSTKVGDLEFSKNGEFIVQELNLEKQNLQSRFNTLNYISKSTNGVFKLRNNSQDIIEQIKNNKNIRVTISKEKSTIELIDIKIFIIILLLLLSLEWFLRKFWGSY